MTPIRFYKPQKETYRPGEAQGAKENPVPFPYISYATKWKNAHGRELWSLQDAKAIEKATITCRYDTEIGKQCKVQKLDDRNTKLWEIESIDDIGNRHVWMEITITRPVRT